MPTDSYGLREFPDEGGLMSCGPNFADLFRRAATFVDKILKGAKPADLPVEQPTKFEFVINVKPRMRSGPQFPRFACYRRRSDRMSATGGPRLCPQVVGTARFAVAHP